MIRNFPKTNLNILHQSSIEDIFVSNPNLVIPSSFDAKKWNREILIKLIETGLYNYEEETGRLFSEKPEDKEIPHYSKVFPLNCEDLDENFINDNNDKILEFIYNENYNFPVNISYEVINTGNHSYFYRKEHEHVPGLMLIETARQAMYHYVYSAYNIDYKDTTISMTSLLAKFDDYTESSFPLSIVVRQTSNEYKSLPRHIDLHAQFFQNGKQIGSVTLTGGVMKQSLFKRLRRFDPGQDRWFSPFLHSNVSSLLQTDDSSIFDCKILALSDKKIKVSFRENSFETKNIQRLIIIKQNMASINIPVNILEVGNDNIVLGYGEITQTLRQSTNEFIKKYCKLSDDALSNDKAI